MVQHEGGSVGKRDLINVRHTRQIVCRVFLAATNRGEGMTIFPPEKVQVSLTSLLKSGLVVCGNCCSDDDEIDRRLHVTQTYGTDPCDRCGYQPR